MTYNKMFYPAYIDLQDRECLVVGGGPVAERKVVAMLLSGGDVTVISPDTTELLTFLARTGTIRWHKRQLKTGDTDGYFLVCAATDFTDINSAVFIEAYEKNKIRLVNVIDVIPQCTFAAASVVTDGELMLSISTSGNSPATSRRIREYFETCLNADSLYTLGYENGKPVRIENQGLRYPVYLLLKRRECVVLYGQKTEEIERRISLLHQCGASVVCRSLSETEPHHLEDAFLVIADTSAGHPVLCRNEGGFVKEFLDKPKAGTLFTPPLIRDANLIISVAARSYRTAEKAERLRKRLASRFENKGYGAFIEFLGQLRPEVLRAFPTPKKRSDFFERLIDNVETNDSLSQTCCLRLTNPECSVECLFNWVRKGRLERACTFTANLLETDRVESVG